MPLLKALGVCILRISTVFASVFASVFPWHVRHSFYLGNPLIRNFNFRSFFEEQFLHLHIDLLTHVDPSVDQLNPGEIAQTVSYVSAELYPSAVRVNSGNIEKVISYDDFVSLLTASRDEKDGDTEEAGLWLPPNVYFFSKKKDTMRVGTYHPSSVQTLNYRGDRRSCLLPNIIISNTLVRQGSEWKVRDTRYFCTPTSLQEMVRRDFISGPNSASKIHLLPFTNIYADGRMCYGSALKISSFVLPDLRGLHSFYRIIIDSEFNGDLGISAIRSSSSYRSDYDGWFKHLSRLAKTNGDFPYSELN